MAINVRLFGFSGTVQLPVVNPKSFQADSVQQLYYPYIWSQFLTTTGATPVNSTVKADKLVTMLMIEVQDDAVIRYEINNATNPPGIVTLPASVNSPKMSGTRNFAFAPFMLVSIIDASAVAP